MDKRPIDKVRDSGGSFKLMATEDDDTGISELLVLNDGLLMVTEKGLYEAKTADQIDPNRTNPQIPHNIQRRILAHGAGSKLVSRTLLTANELFKAKFLSKDIATNRAKSLAFDVLKDLVAMDDISKKFIQDESKEIEKWKSCSKQSGSYAMPALTDFESNCKSFFQKADHVAQAMWDIVRVFYPDLQSKCHFEKLAELCERQFGKGDDFTKFLNEALPFLLMVRNGRNGLDHRNAKAVTLSNFVLRPDGSIVRPGIEINLRETKQPPIEIARLLALVVDSMVNVVESMFAFLSSKNVQNKGGFPVQVGVVPERMRRNKLVQYGYGIVLNNEFCPTQ